MMKRKGPAPLEPAHEMQGEPTKRHGDKLLKQGRDGNRTVSKTRTDRSSRGAGAKAR
jgi:hypothetical protein